MRGISLPTICTMILTMGQASGETWYVEDSVSSSGSGKSWATAFKRIQEGIDASSNGDTVIVAEGTYVENITFDEKNIVLRSTDPLDPTVVASTIIDGSFSGAVVSFWGTENETCVLRGFTIRNGSAEEGGGVCGGAWYQRTHATIQENAITGNSSGGVFGEGGGGLAYCDGTIQNNTITGNSSGWNGGGLYYCWGTIQNNTIAGNTAEYGGALDTCGGTVQNNTIAGNSAEHGGGLSYCDGTIQDNTITGNSSTSGWYPSGGGLSYCWGTIQNNTIAGNSADYGGALDHCDATIQNNTISENTATWEGGGLDWCGGLIQNNTITGNTAAWEGGGLSCCRGTIRNNTITGNSAVESGGGLVLCDGTIQNCIIWGNTAPSGAQLYNCATPTYSCVQDWTGGGEGNTDADPLFSDADGPDDNPDTWEDNNYRLRGNSPCIDAGKNEDWVWSARDADGNLRAYPGGKSLTVDMGAYEYGSWPFRITHALMQPTGRILLTWASRPGDQYAIWSRTDLTSGAWTQKQTVPSAGNSTSWTDPTPGGSRKFYRVELQ